MDGHKKALPLEQLCVFVYIVVRIQHMHLLSSNRTHKDSYMIYILEIATWFKETQKSHYS